MTAPELIAFKDRLELNTQTAVFDAKIMPPAYGERIAFAATIGEMACGRIPAMPPHEKCKSDLASCRTLIDIFGKLLTLLEGMGCKGVEDIVEISEDKEKKVVVVRLADSKEFIPLPEGFDMLMLDALCHLRHLCGLYPPKGLNHAIYGAWKEIQ